MTNSTLFIRQTLHSAARAFSLGWLLLLHAFICSFYIPVAQAQGAITTPEPFVSAADVAPALEAGRGHIARIRAAHGQLNPQLAYAPLGNERDTLTTDFVTKLSRIAYSPLSTPAQRREAVQLWFDLYTATRDWKPNLTVIIRNVDRLRQAAWNLARAARGPDEKAEAKQALLWLIPLMNFGSEDRNGQWRAPHARVVLATPEALPEVREWALSVLANHSGPFEERIGHYRELVAMPHLAPDERGRHLMSFGYFLKNSGRKEEAKQLFSEMTRDEKLPLKERSSAYLAVFNEAPGADKIKIADDALKMFAGPGDERDNWLSWRAGALRDNKQSAEAIAAFDVLAALESAKPYTRTYALLESAKLRFADPATKVAGREALLQLIGDKVLNATSQLETAKLLVKEAFDAKDYAAALVPLERALLIPKLADATRYELRFNLANALASKKKYIEALAHIEQIPNKKPVSVFERQFLTSLFEMARRDKDQPGAQAVLDSMQKRGTMGEGDLKLRTALLKEDANDWAAALAIYRELLPQLQKEADRKAIQDSIARVEAKINP